MPQENNLHEDDRDVIAAGYKPQLHRKIGFFGSFAVSFSVMSVLMGVFANYGFVLGKAGPFGLWTWIIVGVGQLLVALVFAEMAGRIPLTGALYNWNDKLGHPSISSLVGLLSAFAYAIAGAGIMVIVMAPLQSFLGQSLSMNEIRWIGVGIITLQLLINVWGVRLASNINRLAVILEIGALLFFGLLLALVIIFRGQGHPTLLTTIPSTPIPYWPVFLISTLLGAWTIFGFESPADISEETVNVKTIAPKSIILSVITSVVLGGFFIGIVTIAIPNLATVSATADPISTIFSYHLGITATQILLLCVLLAMFATSLLNITVASRILFAISRDRKFIAHNVFKKVSSHGIPIYSALFVALIEVIVFLTMYGLPAIYAAAIVLLFLSYLITVINFAIGIKKLPPTNKFSLRKWHWPVVVLSVVWLVFQICILTIPTEFHLAAEITAGIVILGFIQYFLYKFFANKNATREVV